MPESLTSLGDQTFIGCNKLKSINIPSKITYIGITGFMFQETGFLEFTIPENVKNISDNTFRVCKSLKKVFVYSDDLIYGDNVFEYCPSDLVLYGNEGSTTQVYAEQNGIQFKLLSTENELKPESQTTLIENQTSNSNTSNSENQTVNSTNTINSENHFLNTNTINNEVQNVNSNTNNINTILNETETSNSNTTNKILPYTGNIDFILLLLIILVLVTFVSYKKYSDI